MLQALPFPALLSLLKSDVGLSSMEALQRLEMLLNEASGSASFISWALWIEKNSSEDPGGIPDAPPGFSVMQLNLYTDVSKYVHTPY